LPRVNRTDRVGDRARVLPCRASCRSPQVRRGNAIGPGSSHYGGSAVPAGRSPHANYLFKHALVQDAAYGTLLREPRGALHARIAEVLETQFAEIAENQPQLLARHCAEAGDATFEVYSCDRFHRVAAREREALYSSSNPKSVMRRLAALSRTIFSTSSEKPSIVSAAISSTSVIVVPRARSSSLRID